MNLMILSLTSSGSAYTTVALAVERSYAIFSPFNCHINNVDVSSRRKSFLWYLVPVVLLSLLHNLPTLTSSLTSAFHAYTSGYQPFVIVVTILRISFYISANLYIFIFLQANLFSQTHSIDTIYFEMTGTTSFNNISSNTYYNTNDSCIVSWSVVDISIPTSW